MSEYWRSRLLFWGLMAVCVLVGLAIGLPLDMALGYL